MSLYESLVKTERHLPDNLKNTLLKNVVASNSNLRSIKDQCDQTHTHQGIELTCDQCSTLVLSDSTNYDSQFTSTTSKTSRRTHDTKIGDNNFNKNSPSKVNEEFDYNIDSSTNTLLASMTNSNSDTYLPSEDYDSLTPEAKEVRSKLPSDVKSIILKDRSNKPSNKFNSHKHKSMKPSSYKIKPFTKANLHELLSDLLEDTRESENDDIVIEDKNEVNDSDSVLLVNATSASSITPGEIRKLLSTPAKG